MTRQHGRGRSRQPARSTSSAHPRAHTPRPPTIAATTRASALGPARDPWAHGLAAVGGGLPVRDLEAGSAGLLDVLLELAGAEQLSLHSTLNAWQREQDRLLNRAWRRPGGLARPAGL